MYADIVLSTGKNTIDVINVDLDIIPKINEKITFMDWNEGSYLITDVRYIIRDKKIVRIIIDIA